MSSGLIPERVRMAWRVFREDPDEVVTLSEDDDYWTARYRGAEWMSDTERGALGTLFMALCVVRGDFNTPAEIHRLWRDTDSDSDSEE